MFGRPEVAEAAQLNVMAAGRPDAVAKARPLLDVLARKVRVLGEDPLLAGRSYETYSAKIAKGDYEPGFRMLLGLKDLRLATAAAEKTGERLPLLDAVRARMSEAVKAGMGDKDWSGLADYTIHHQN